MNGVKRYLFSGPVSAMSSIEAETSAIEHILVTLSSSDYQNYSIGIWSDSMHAIYVVQQKISSRHWFNLKIFLSQAPRRYIMDADKLAKRVPGERYSLVDGCRCCF